MMANATSLKNQPGTKPMPTLKAAAKDAKEISEVMELSNIQMMKGMSTNIKAPLTRCKIDTQPAAGNRYVGKSLMALILRNSGL